VRDDQLSREAAAAGLEQGRDRRLRPGLVGDVDEREGGGRGAAGPDEVAVVGRAAAEAVLDLDLEALGALPAEDRDPCSSFSFFSPDLGEGERADGLDGDARRGGRGLRRFFLEEVEVERVRGLGQDGKERNDSFISFSRPYLSLFRWSRNGAH
jgi:hypothetical protein